MLPAYVNVDADHGYHLEMYPFRLTGASPIQLDGTNQRVSVHRDLADAKYAKGHISYLQYHLSDIFLVGEIGEMSSEEGRSFGSA